MWEPHHHGGLDRSSGHAGAPLPRRPRAAGGPVLCQVARGEATRPHAAHPAAPNPDVHDADRPLRARLAAKRLRSHEATDGRDKVFALLGITRAHIFPFKDPEKAELIKPDYTSAMTPERLFTRATRLLLESRRDLRLLVTKESPIMTQIRTLPSWVPGYTVAHVPNPLGVPLGSVFLACGTMEWTHDGRRYDDPLLGVQGYCLGSIEQHSMNPFLPDGRYANSPAEESLVWGTICDVAAGLGDYYRVQPS